MKNGYHYAEFDDIISNITRTNHETVAGVRVSSIPVARTSSVRQRAESGKGSQPYILVLRKRATQRRVLYFPPKSGREVQKFPRLPVSI